MGRLKPIRTYRNPIFLAREWQKGLESGEYASQTDLARKMGVSRARMSQVLHLLRLCPEVLKTLENFGDPMTSKTVTERKLRPMVNLSKAEQKLRLKEMSG